MRLHAYFFLLAFAAALPARAESGQGWFDSVAVYAGQGADHNLRELPGAVAAGDIAWERSYFNAIGIGKIQGEIGQSCAMLQGTPLGAITRGYELVLAQHHGMQDNAEVGAAFTLRTPELGLGRVGVGFSSGFGLSYALGNPAYEDGPLDDPARRYRTQLMLLFDLEWRIRGLDAWSLVMRVHHRSGVYGLIAPRHVGSNFLAAGLRYAF